ncbi:MAG: hypothetical protein MJA27_01085 [Pseudanabaenales cyanobacterium]|nr:hypothetical protein [Pseudanabaenales cyanobacterium]
MNIISGSGPDPFPKKRVIVLLLSIFTAFGFGLGSGIVRGLGQVPYQPRTVIQPNPSPLTLADYERLKIGMSLATVELLINTGTEESRSDTKVTVIWKNADDSYIRVIFEEDALKSKEQHGLVKHASCIQ